MESCILHIKISISSHYINSLLNLLLLLNLNVSKKYSGDDMNYKIMDLRSPLIKIKIISLHSKVLMKETNIKLMTYKKNLIVENEYLRLALEYVM